jgi:transcription elongation GreA/GreB family factor
MSTGTVPSAQTDIVRLGSRVRLRDDGGETEFAIVEPSEADIGAGRVSSESPIGRANGADRGRRAGEFGS